MAGFFDRLVGAEIDPTQLALLKALGQPVDEAALQKRARQQGLMRLGAGLVQNSQPGMARSAPWAAGLASAQGAGDDLVGQEFDKVSRVMQIKAMLEQQTQAKAARDNWAKLTSPENLAKMNLRPDQMQIVQMIGAMGPSVEGFKTMAEFFKNPELEDYFDAEAAAADPTNPLHEKGKAIVDARSQRVMDQRRAGAQNMTVNLPPREEKFEGKSGELGAVTIDEMRKGIVKASANIPRLARLEQIFKTTNTGRIEDVLAQLGAWAGSPAGATRDVVLADAEKMVLEMAEALKPVSNIDIEGLRKMFPSFRNDPRAALQMIQNLRAGMADANTNYQDAVEFAKANGGTLNGWLPPSARQLMQQNDGWLIEEE